VCGFTVEDRGKLAAAVVRILTDRDLQQRMREAAIERSKAYRSDHIVDTLLQEIGLVGDAQGSLIDEPPIASENREVDDLGAWHMDPEG
jgi:hypothetical protein